MCNGDIVWICTKCLRDITPVGQIYSEGTYFCALCDQETISSQVHAVFRDQLESRILIKMANNAMKYAKRKGHKPIPWEKVKKDIDLD